jgi:hypothetical protein
MNSFTPQFGRWEDPAHTEAFFASQPHPTVRQAAPLLFEQDDDADVDLCLLYEKVTGQRWNSLNQNPRGFCVGFGNAKMATLALAMMAHAREIDWPGADVAIEPIYGGSRFEIGKLKHGSTLHRGDDGSVGSWAAEWLLNYGVLLKKQYDRVDLTRYSMERCALYGQTGVDDSIEDDAKLHPIQQMSLCERGLATHRATAPRRPLFQSGLLDAAATGWHLFRHRQLGPLCRLVRAIHPEER